MSELLAEWLFVVAFDAYGLVLGRFLDDAQVHPPGLPFFVFLLTQLADQVRTRHLRLKCKLHLVSTALVAHRLVLAIHASHSLLRLQSLPIIMAQQLFLDQLLHHLLIVKDDVIFTEELNFD